MNNVTNPILVSREPPPPDYYQTNIESVIRAVLQLYGDILDEENASFGKTVLELPTDAIRLFARLCTRKGELFRLDSLQYDEISDVQVAITELTAANFVSLASSVELEDILNLYSRAQLLEWFPDLRSNQSRTDLQQNLLQTQDDSVIRSRLQTFSPCISFDVRRAVDTYSTLFFGNTHEDLTTFVLRDLGLRRYEDYDLDARTRLFQSKAALAAYLNLLDLLSEYEISEATACAERIKHFVSQLQPISTDRVIERIRSRFINRLARDLERLREFEAAAGLYLQSTMHPARERLVRCYRKLKQKSEEVQLIADIKRSPWTLEELDFAHTFGTRIREADLCAVETHELAPNAIETSIEDYAIQQLANKGVRAWHLENALPTGLFSLTYWEWLFAPVAGAFVNEFQSAPLDLFWPDFFAKREKVCEDPLESTGSLKAWILHMAQMKRGIACRGINWDLLTDDVLKSLLAVISTQTIQKLLTIMKQDLRQTWSGFPDLTVIREDSTVEFVEVKGPNDRLQVNQRIWLRSLIEQDVPVSLLRFRESS